MMFNDLYLLPCDIVLVSQKRSWLSRQIRRFSTSPSDKTKTVYSHAAIVYKSFQLIEALAGGVQLTNLKRYSKGYRVMIARRLDLSDADQFLIINKAYSFIDKKYGFLKLIAHLGDYYLSWFHRKNVFFFRKLTRSKEYVICSWVVAFAYAARKMFFNRTNPEYCQPDDIADEIEQNPGKYRIIYKI